VINEILAIGEISFIFQRPRLVPVPTGMISTCLRRDEREPALRKLIAFDDDTFDKLKQLGRDRMGTLQELADEAFADLLRKHGIPVDLRDALRKSASASPVQGKDAPIARSGAPRPKPARRAKERSR
jgi:hypothetical protein